MSTLGYCMSESVYASPLYNEGIYRQPTKLE